jgi:class 3 adenylate cyclase
MGADEEGTLAALRTIRRELGDPKIREHRGRIVKTTGDGLLVEFASVVDAVRCAVEVQREMALRNANIPPEQRIELRMGINIGDVNAERLDNIDRAAIGSYRAGTVARDIEAAGGGDDRGAGADIEGL